MSQMDMFEKRKGLSPLQQDQLKKITTLLGNMGCMYVIRTPDKLVLTNREEVKAAKKPRNLSVPYGTWITYIKPYLENVKEGEVVFIPNGSFDPIRLHKNICATASGLWGNKSYVTAVRDDGVEIMRGGI